MCFFWFIRFSIYFGLNYQITHMNHILFETSVALGISELIGTICSGYIRLHYSPKRIFWISLWTITGVSLSMYYFKIPESCSNCSELSGYVLFNIVLKFAITIYNITLMGYTTEAFPT